MATNRIILELLLVFAVLAGSVFKTSAQQQDYSFILLSPEDGYPSDIRSINVTSHFAVICTPDGAYQISNGTMQALTTRSPKPYTIPDNNIYFSLRDKASNNWILTGGGILFAKGYTGMYSRMLHLLDNDARAFTALSTDAACYLGGTNSIWKYDFATGDFFESAIFETPTEFNITSMVQFAHDRIFLMATGANGAYEYNPDTDRVKPVNADLGNNFTAALCDSMGNLWLSCAGEGVVCYDRNLHRTKTYTSRNSSLSNDHVLCLMEKDGRIWAGTYGGGLNIINPETDEIEILHYVEGDPNPFPNDFITSLTTDALGNVWVGTCHGGAFLVCTAGIHPFPFSAIRPELKHDGASVLFYDVKDDTYWCGFRGAGIVQFGHGKSIIQYPETKGMSISSIAGYGKDYLIFSCSPEGVYKLRKDNGAITPITIFKAETDRHRYGDDGPILSNDAIGKIIGTSDQVYRYDPENDALESWPLPECTDGHMYPVFGGRGEFFFDNTTLYGWEEDAPNKIVPLVTIDSDKFTSGSTGPGNTIWLSTLNGILKYSRETGEHEFFSLLLDSELRSVVYVFRTNTIWIGTSNFLYTFNPDSHNILRVDKSFGALETTYEPKGKMVDKSGNLYIAGRSGISIIRQDVFASQGNDEPPVMRINNVNVDGVNVDDFSNLVINPKYNTADISFFPIDKRILRHKKYHFIIDGPGPLGRTEYLKDEPEFHFKANLPAGEYNISGSCTDIDGSWTQMQHLFTFHVRRVWYKTWWFVILVLLFIFLVTMVIRRTRKKFTAQKAEVEKARMASEMKSLFVQNLSHDVRTPLNAICGYSQLLALPEGTLTDEEREEFVEYITTSSDMLIMLVDDVLNMADIERGVYKVKKEKASCNDICNKSVKCCATRVLPGVKLYYTSDKEGEDHYLFSDPKRIQQILVNFLTNACKHTVHGQIHVHYSLSERPGFVTFSVTDTGDGVPKEIAEAIFTRFTTFDASKGGHGLGLNICNTISKSLGGKVELDMSYTNGARFLFVIPDTPDEV